MCYTLHYLSSVKIAIMNTPEKRVEILDLALRLFLRHGYKKVTMVDVARAAGISRPTLYASYPNKESVFRSIIEQRARDYETEFHRRLRSAMTAEERLKIPFDIWVTEPYREVRKHPEAQELLEEASRLAPRAMQLLWEAFERVLSSIIEHELHSKTSAAVASTIAQICSATARDAKSRGLDDRKVRELIDTLIAMILRLIRPNGVPVVAHPSH
jgi:AcrR family transcriptional regulator